jgi:hypothetical protein
MERLNQDHSNHYAMTNKISFGRVGAGNVEKTHEDVSAILCLPTAAIQHHYFDFDGECQPSKRKKKGPDLIAVDDWII